jgi:hypothetical protein
MLVEECLELATGWLIDDILSERRRKGGHKRSISRAPPASKLPLIGNARRLPGFEPRETSARSGAGGHVGGQDVVRVAAKVLPAS